MRPSYNKTKVLENIRISDNVYKLTIYFEHIGQDIYPGQFYLLRSWNEEPILSRPISIFDAQDEGISFLYEVRGRGTENLSRLKKGDNLEALGPLGKGFKTENISGKIAVVTGGIGIAPMYYAVKTMKNCEIDLFSGFRENPFGLEMYDNYVNNIKVTTNNGGTGYRGYITDIFSPWEYNAVLCCGPEVMMRKVAQSCIMTSTPVYISMEKHMACGLGACLVCTCSTKTGKQRVCKDGPVFNGRDVI